jgi:hypothetical protein
MNYWLWSDRFTLAGGTFPPTWRLGSPSTTGIDPAIADRRKDGHFGLQGMRERGARIAAKLVLVSSSNSGTEIKLIVAGGVVFEKNKPGRLSLFSRIRALFRSKNKTSHLD